jgi:hypothetical protein
MALQKRKTGLLQGIFRFFKTHKMLGSGLLLFLLLLDGSIAVSFASPHAQLIENPAAANLPGKNRFLDGTLEVKGALIDPDTGFPAPEENGEMRYPSFAIASPLTFTSTYENEMNAKIKAYGRGGAIVIESLLENRESEIDSPIFLYEQNQDHEITLIVDQEAMAKTGLSPDWSLSLRADLDQDGTEESVIPLLSPSHTYGTTRLSSSSIYSSVLSATSLSSFSAKLALMVDPLGNGVLPTLYVSSLSLTRAGASVESISFLDATRMLASSSPWLAQKGTKLGIYHSELRYADFRFDAYAKAFGFEDSGFQEMVFLENEVNDFIAHGYLSYTWQKKASTDVSSFQILDSVHCPIRSVSEELLSDGHSSLRGLVSPYRYQYAQGLIPSCAPQSYALGTNAKGQDFVVLIARGFLFSTGLALALTAFVLLGAYFLGLVAVHHEDDEPSKWWRYLVIAFLYWLLIAGLWTYQLRSFFGLALILLSSFSWLIGVYGLARRLPFLKRARGDRKGKVESLLPERFDALASPGVFLFPSLLLFEMVLAPFWPTFLSIFDKPTLGSALQEAVGVLGRNDLPLIALIILVVLTLIFSLLILGGLFSLCYISQKKLPPGKVR